MSPRERALFAALSLALACACTELPDVDASCGNGVIESAKEDCDSSDPSCRPPGDDFECRRDCSIDPGSGERRACPDGWGCGTDSICRAPSGGFETVSPLTGVITLRLAPGDLDADGATDLVANHLSGLDTLFFDAAGGLAAKTSLAATPFVPLTVGALADDGVAPQEPDALVLASQTLSVYLGQDDRTLSTKSYASFPVEADTLRYVILDAHPTEPFSGAFEGDEILGFIQVDGPASCKLIDAFSNTELFSVQIGLDNVQQSVVTGDVDPSTPCDELVLAGPQRDHVTVFSLCEQVDQLWTWKTANNARDLALPAGYRVAKSVLNEQSDAGVVQPPHVITGDANQDGLLDVLVNAEQSGLGGAYLFVGYGVGNGTFHSDPDVPKPVNPGDPIPPGNDQLSQYPGATGLGAMPLAVGVLTDDGVLDFVTPDGIFFSSSTASCVLGMPFYGCVTDPFSLRQWSKAAIGDFNGNGIPDVAALASDGGQFSFLNGVGDAFVRSDVQSSGAIRDFAIGDFDGDLLKDITLQEVSLTGGGQVSVLFGKPFGPPEPGSVIAKFAAVDQIGSGRFAFGVSDAIDDIGVLSRSTSGALGAALFSGSSDRRLTSPFTLFVDDPASTDDAAAIATNAVIGRFDGDAHADLAVVSTGINVTVPGGGPTIDSASRLWLLPSTGEADLDAATATHSAPLPESILWCTVTVRALDLDGDGPQEVVLLSAGGDAQGNLVGSVAVGRATTSGDGGKATFEVGPGETTTEVFGDQYAGIQCGIGVQGSGGKEDGDGLPYATPALVADFDHDDDEDLITIGAVFDLASGTISAQRLMVLRNDLTGSLPVSSYVISDITLEPGSRVNALAAIQLDLDPQLELLIGAVGASPDSLVGGTIYLAELDATGKLGPLEPIVERPAIALAVGDFDGNGVQDFASGGIDGVQLGLGQPVLP